jgi:hypothetical protein
MAKSFGQVEELKLNELHIFDCDAIDGDVIDVTDF